MFVGGAGSAHVPVGTAPQSDASSVDGETVPFVTVRAIEQQRKGVTYFGPQRGEASAGACTVDLDAREKRQIVGLRLRTLTEILDEFFAPEDRVAVYVHGYNEAFEQSCGDAALLQKRLGLEYRLLLFSWPAQGKLAGYLPDVGDIDWSVEALSDLVLTLADRFGSQNVDLIGHSLGAKAVVDAVGDIAQGGAGVLGRVMLVAPDLDVDVFLRKARELRERASVVTVYVSAQDRALKASRHMRDEPRVGEGGRVIADLDGIDIVEVDQRRWRWGALHEYHLKNESVADDMREVLSGPPHAAGPRIIRH